MLHNLSARSATSLKSSFPQPETTLHLANSRAVREPSRPANAGPLPDLVLITARRCSAFFAEAAVLVLVFGLLDYFMLKGRIEVPWIVGALAISLGLLALSIVMDLSAHRWIRAHP